MFSKPRIRGNTHIYRLRRGYRRQLLFLNVVFALLIPFAIYGYNLNSNEGFVIDAAVSIGLLGLMGLLIWLTIQVAFIFRLETSPDGAVFYGMGKTITFEWQDAHKLDYVALSSVNRFQLCLFLNRSDLKSSFAFPYPTGWFPIPSSAKIIPVDVVYKYQSFFSIKLEREMPTFDELNIHIRYFVKTPLGQDLIRYAPHIFEPVLHKYLPDNDLTV